MMVKPSKKNTRIAPTCGKTNHPVERCWKGAGAQLTPKNLKLDESIMDNAPTSQSETINKSNASILKNLKN